MPFGKRSSFEHERRTAENARLVQALVEESIRRLDKPSPKEMAKAIGSATQRILEPNRGELTYEIDEEYLESYEEN